MYFNCFFVSLFCKGKMRVSKKAAPLKRSFFAIGILLIDAKKRLYPFSQILIRM